MVTFNQDKSNKSRLEVPSRTEVNFEGDDKHWIGWFHSLFVQDVGESRVESISHGSIFIEEVAELQLLELDVLDDQLELGDLLVLGEVLEDRCLLEVVAGGLRRQLVLLVLLLDLLSLGVGGRGGILVEGFVLRRVSLPLLSGHHVVRRFLIRCLRLVLGVILILVLLLPLLLSVLQPLFDPLSLLVNMVLQGRVELVVGTGAFFPFGIAFQVFPVGVAVLECWQHIAMELSVVLELGVIQLVVDDHVEQSQVDIILLAFGELLIQVVGDLSGFIFIVHMVCFIYK